MDNTLRSEGINLSNPNKPHPHFEPLILLGPQGFVVFYFKTRINTPKIKVEATNPTPTNPAIIPVLR